VRFIAITALTAIYATTFLIVKIGRLFGRGDKRHNRIIINGTFHNPNWFHAHIEPIVKSGYGEVILVTDEPIAELENLTYICPPPLANKLFTRAGAKFIWTFVAGIKKPADLYIGYHIFPSAITALIVSSVLGGRSCYQVTSGALELEGGGYAAENKLLVALRGPSKLVETVLNKVVQLFDLVIVRGNDAKKYIEKIGYKNNLEVVTGSVLTDDGLISEKRDIDIIFVGRLAEYKRPDIFLENIMRVVHQLPSVKVKMVGDGPLRAALENQAEDLIKTGNVEFYGQRRDVPQLLGRSKIIVLTSRWEGVSIAMLEAMALGVIPIVVDVGDLKDFVIVDKTGFLVPGDSLDSIHEKILNVLNDESLWGKLSENSRQLVYERCDRDILSRRWKSIINQTVSAP